MFRFTQVDADGKSTGVAFVLPLFCSGKAARVARRIILKVEHTGSKHTTGRTHGLCCRLLLSQTHFFWIKRQTRELLVYYSPLCTLVAAVVLRQAPRENPDGAGGLSWAERLTRIRAGVNAGDVTNFAEIDLDLTFELCSLFPNFF